MLPTHSDPIPIELSGPVLFLGDETSLTVGLLAGLRSIRPGQPLLIVDGANAFNPFLIATLARKAGLQPKGLLDDIRISRVFTCHQMEALLTGRMQRSLQQFGAKAVLFSGLLDPLLDGEVTLTESVRIFRLIPPMLRQLTTHGATALCVCPPLPVPPGRDQFLEVLKASAAWIFEVSREGERVRIRSAKPRDTTWIWEPTVGMLVARRWW